MSNERSPQDIAAEYCHVIKTYRETRRRGQRHHQAFIAAIRSYCERHPDVPKPAAAHTVTQMIRAMDGPTAA